MIFHRQTCLSIGKIIQIILWSVSVKVSHSMHDIWNKIKLLSCDKITHPFTSIYKKKTYKITEQSNFADLSLTKKNAAIHTYGVIDNEWRLLMILAQNHMLYISILFQIARFMHKNVCVGFFFQLVILSFILHTASVLLLNFIIRAWIEAPKYNARTLPLQKMEKNTNKKGHTW